MSDSVVAQLGGRGLVSPDREVDGLGRVTAVSRDAPKNDDADAEHPDSESRHGKHDKPQGQELEGDAITLSDAARHQLTDAGSTPDATVAPLSSLPLKVPEKTTFHAVG